jgi:hypothetical protein
MKRMTAWLTILILGMLPSVVVGQTGGGASQPDARPSSYQSDPPTYAISLIDGRAAILWWDGRSNPQQPHWVCEVPAGRQGTATSVTALPGARSDWRAALSSATALLKARDLVADGE